ncbi:uncharacterized protein LOC110038702 [Phalaenopsis equestris]|uniref:uncharacterized protein LOC110038702 n=1 Tax=Phalaenopsis equestris TaxID=78828 RepID=UPI0009E238E2|nr:uncharacterized protein LOC110038702 [Phalaenopsis equestris]
MMSSLKLIFSLTKGLPHDKAARYAVLLIKFWTDFDEFGVILGKAPYVFFKTTAPIIEEPTIEFDLNCEQGFPTLRKSKVRETPTKSDAPIANITTTLEADTKKDDHLKAPMVERN